MDYKSIYTLLEIHEYLRDADVVAFDFETAPDDKYRDETKSALDAHKAHIVGISFSVLEGTAIYVPLAHNVGRNADAPDKIMLYLKEHFFMNGNVIKVAHNLSFESMFLYALGIVIQPPVYDSIAASQLTLKNNYEFRNLSDSGLKKLSVQLFAAVMPDFETVTNGRYFDELSPQDDETVNYACADSDYALRLYYRFNDWFDRYLPKHQFIVEQIESPTAIFVGLMKYNGLLADTDLMLKKQCEAEQKLTEIRDKISFIIGDVELGANASTSAFKKYLYNDLQLPVLKTTAKCREAADDEAMILLSEWCKEHRPELTSLFELVQEYRKWGKLKSTYIDGYLPHINAATERIHPDMLQLGTQTGRFSSRNPNLQNCPRKDNDPVGVRKFFIAPPDKLIMSLDFSQIELRVGAFYCRDKKMLDTYRSNGDIHAQTTSVIFGIPFEQAVDKNTPGYKERRSIAKNCNFGVFYGLFPNGLQRTLKFKAGLDTSVEECEQIIRNLKAGYPELERWQNEVKAKLPHRKYSETFLGRRRYLPGIDSQDWGKRSFAERCALNTPIQGTAADILKLAMCDIVQGLPDRMWLKPVLQIHDELVFELPKDKLPDAVSFVRSCMEQQPFLEFDVPIVAEASVGCSFGSLEELD